MISYQSLLLSTIVLNDGFRYMYVCGYMYRSCCCNAISGYTHTLLAIATLDHSSVTCTSQWQSRLAIYLKITYLLNLYSQGSYVCTNV